MAVLEGTVNEPADLLCRRVVGYRPDILGISCQIWNVRAARALAAGVKRALPDCVIVFGGPEVSYCADEVLRRDPDVDYVVCGEGEYPFAALADALVRRLPADGIPGVLGRGGKGAAAPVPYRHAQAQPSPYCREYFAGLDGRIAYLETSRGCPFSCAFCLSGRQDQLLQQVSLRRAESEMLALAASGAQTVKLVDRTFNADQERAKQLFRFLAGRAGKDIPAGVRFHFEVAGDLLDDGTIDILNSAPPGLFGLEIGVQSFNADTLRALRRRTDFGRLREAVSRLVSANRVHVHLDLMTGLPLEGPALFRRSFEEAFALRPHALQLCRLKVIHGSAIREEPRSFPCRHDPDPPYAVLETPWMREEDFAELALLERGLERAWNRRRFTRAVEYLCGECGLSPYEVLLDLGRRIRLAEAALTPGGGALPLDGLTACALSCFVSLMPDRQERIRDLLALDRLASTRTNLLPDCLKVRDPLYRQAGKALDRVHPRPEGSVRASALLRAGTAPALAWSDHMRRDSVTGLYPVSIATLYELGLGSIQ